MRKTSLVLIVFSFLTLQVFSQENKNLQRMLNDKDIHGIQNFIDHDSKNGEAYFMAAIYYGMNDALGANKNIEKQIEYLKKSADLGFAEGQLQYGFYLLNQGQGSKGLSYLDQAVSQNSVKAMTLLGDLYFAGYQDQQGNIVIQSNPDKAIEYLNQAVAQDSQSARYTLAYLYLDPNIGQQNLSKSIELFEANINFDNQSGDLASIVALLDVYLTNPNVKVGSGKILDLYYLAYLQGYVPAFYAVGMMQKEGAKGERFEISKDLQAAFENLLKAAQAGYVDAMFRIGEMYFKGEGVDQSDHNAYIWMSIAEELSNSETKYSETILELVPRKERQTVIEQKNHQLQLFSGAQNQV